MERCLKGKRYLHQVIKNNLFPRVNSALRAKMQYLKSQIHGWLVGCLDLTALCDSISVYVGSSLRQKEKEEK